MRGNMRRQGNKWNASERREETMKRREGTTKRREETMKRREETMCFDEDGIRQTRSRLVILTRRLVTFSLGFVTLRADSLLTARRAASDEA